MTDFNCTDFNCPHCGKPIKGPITNKVVCENCKKESYIECIQSLPLPQYIIRKSYI